MSAGDAVLYAALNMNGRVVYSHESRENVEMNAGFIKTPTRVVGLTPIAPPVAAGSLNTCAEMRALCSACGGTGDVHSIDGEWRGQCTCVHAWQQRADKAEARVKELEASRQVLQSEGRHPAPCARDCEAPAFTNQVRTSDARIAQLEAQLVRRRTPLSPETQQAIATARAAGQTIAATPAGLVFMNDGAEPGSGELDCPTCGGSGHAGDVAAGSAP